MLLSVVTHTSTDVNLAYKTHMHLSHRAFKKRMDSALPLKSGYASQMPMWCLIHSFESRIATSQHYPPLVDVVLPLTMGPDSLGTYMVVVQGSMIVYGKIG